MSERVSISSLFSPHPKQREFLSAITDHDFLLFGGAAGAGKSRTLRWAAVCLLLDWAGHGFTGARVGLFCEDYPSLHDRQISKVKFEFPSWLGTYREQQHEFTLAPQFGSGVICFRNLDDVSKYLSAEFAAILVDELTRNEEFVFNILRMRLRWPGIERPKFLAATNPGGPGHSWVKRLWLDRDFPDSYKSPTDITGQFKYIPAKATDNPSNAVSYVRALESLPEDLRRAYLEGDWDIFEGQMFSEFRRETHVITPFEIPAWWRKWAANDPGFSDPSSWHWFAADPDGTVYVYRERTYQRVPPSQQAMDVRLSTGDEDIEAWIVGMDAFNPHPETGKATKDYYAEGGVVGLRRCVHGDKSRKFRAETLHEYLHPVLNKDGKLAPKLKIFESCSKLAATLPSLPRDDNKPEQVKECSADHWYDSLTYGICWWHAEKSNEPQKSYQPGTAGHLFGHEDVFNPKPETHSVFDHAKGNWRTQNRPLPPPVLRGK